MAEQLSGTVERVTFHNPDTGWAVLRVHARGRRGLVTVVGRLPSVTAGEYLDAVGSWSFDPQHGEQFKADELRSAPPSTAEGIEKYLASGLVKGIGPKYARKIVQVFGERTLEIIDESPSYLKEVKGIGPRRIQQIRESWRQQKTVRDIMVFLQSHGLGTAQAVRIYKTYGDQAVETVRANPYRLATDVWGIGFKTADELAGRLGVDAHSPFRARAAIHYVLKQAAQEGHVAYPESAVVEETARTTRDRGEVPAEVIREAIAHERKEGEVVAEPAGEGGTWLYLKPLFLAELGIARSVRKLRTGEHPLPALDVDSALAGVEARMGLRLADMQREAVRAAAREKVLIVTGGPGVGKTTLVRAILEVFAGRGLRCALCAPTGRAAKRLTETTGREAKTIHRLLEVDPALGGFKRNAVNLLDLDLLVVDEASMVDVSLMYQLARAVPAHACLVLVGDVDQLPSVGPGLVLADLIASRAVPVVRLTEIFRQAGRSWIVRAAHAIKAGELPESAPPGGQGDFYFVEADSSPAIVDRVLTMVRERIPKRFGLDPLRDVQVLTPMKGSELGSEALNLRLQELLNPARGGAQVQRFGWTFRVGDKVIQTHNDYGKEVFNGDIGRVASIDEAERELVVDYEGRLVPYDFGELDELNLAFALTVHKCVAGYEMAAVQGVGLLPVAEVRVGHQVHTGRGGCRRVLDHVNTGEKRIVRVRTRSGYTLDVSEEHPLLVASAAEGPHFRRAGQLGRGWYACIDRSVVEGEDVRLPPVLYHQTNKPQKRVTPPAVLTEEFAWALGALVGDGCYRDRRDGSIELTNRDPELVARYRAFFEGCGLRVGVKYGPRGYRVYFTSAPLRRWLQTLGLEHVLADRKRTPPVVFRAGASARAAYLRGLFDTDGSAGATNVRFTTSSRQLARDVHLLLLSLGVVSVLSRQNDRHYKVTISGPSLAPFRERIGFTLRTKAGPLTTLVGRTRKGKTNRDVIPFGWKLMHEYKEGLGKCRGVAGKGLSANRSRRFTFLYVIARGVARATYAHLRRLAERSAETGDPLPQSIAETLSRNYFYDQIVAAEHLPGSAEMYDLEVEGHHSFVVNGFVCHNSQGSEYPAVVIPLHTQHFKLLQRNLLYTGVTRGKKLVVLVGSRKALELAVRNQDTARRCSLLRKRLAELMDEGPGGEAGVEGGES